MKRSGRLLNIAAAASLVLCVTAASLWIRSHWVKDSAELVIHRSNVAHFWLKSEDGRLTLYASFSTAHNFSFGKSRNVRGCRWFSSAAAPTEYSSWSNSQHFLDGHFGYEHFADIPPFPQYSDYYFRAPHWLFVASGGIVPFIWMLRRWRFARRGVLNCCNVCGYDLCATPEKCPECGTAAIIAKEVGV